MKEITESWAMLEAAKKFVPQLNEYYVVIVGDGCSPRTGAMFAYYTKAEVLSVDPNFNMAHWTEHYEKQKAMGFEPKRIQIVNAKIEDIDISCNNKPCLIIWPHSHANMNNVRLFHYTKRIDIAMPCCVHIPKDWLSQAHITYVDYNVLSPKNTIHIWGINA